MVLAPALLLLSLAGPPRGAGNAGTTGATDLALPPSPAAEAWSAVTAETVPRPFAGEPWPPWSNRGPDGWGGPAPWRRWVDTVRAEAREGTDPLRRASLALLARARGHDFEAWDHFAACAASPGVLAALAPTFFPGVPPGTLAGAGGAPAPLPAGVLLTPALPPRPFVRDGVAVGLVEHAMELGGFRVGKATLSMRLELERDGVQVDLFHLEGPPVTVRILLPAPPKEEIGVAYVDWFRQDEPHAPLEVTLSAEEAKHELWGRFRTHSAPWPSRRPRKRPAQLALAGLAVRVPAAELASPFLGELAAALGRLLDVPSGLVAAGAPPAGAGLEPLTIHLAPGPDRERKVSGLLSLAETFVLEER